MSVASTARAAETSTKPQRLSDTEVPYPAGGRGDAEVLLDLDVSDQGDVLAAKLRHGKNPFAQAARAAALNWRFTPALRKGVPTRSRTSIRVLFRDPNDVIPALGPVALLDDPGGNELDGALVDAASEVEPDEVVVLADRQNEIGGTLIPREEARQIPGVFADPFRVAEVLPGIAPIVSGLPYFFVRGAPPGNVGYFIDGIRVPLLFHVGAGSSILAPGLIDRVDIVPSGYSARFGRAAGGIMSGETMGSTGITRGEFQARVFDASGLVEVPLAERYSSLLVSGRYSYVQPLLDRVAPDYALGYWDYQARANYQPSDTNLFTLFAFGASDRLRSRPLEKTLFDTKFHRLDLRWDHTTQASTTRVALTGSIDSTANTDEDESDYASLLEMRGLRLRFSTAQQMSRNTQLRIGGDAGLDQVLNERLVRAGLVEDIPDRTDLSGSLFLDTVLRGPGVEVVPGLRLDAARWRGQRHLFAEPRLSSRLRLFEHFAWVSQLGVTHQLPTQNVLIPGQGADPLEFSVQEAWQAAQGFEFGVPSVLGGRITGFHTWIDSEEDQLSGRSYGLEFLLRRNIADNVGGILSYTLSRTRATIGRDSIPTEYDRTHVISLVLGFQLGSGFQLGARSYYASGQRYAVSCPTPECGPGDPTARRTYSQRGTLPDFYRIDVRLEKRWELGTTAWLALTFEWFNATLSKEVISISWQPATGGLAYDDLAPLTLPSLGLEGGF